MADYRDTDKENHVKFHQIKNECGAILSFFDKPTNLALAKAAKA